MRGAYETRTVPRRPSWLHPTPLLGAFLSAVFASGAGCAAGAPHDRPGETGGMGGTGGGLAGRAGTTGGGGGAGGSADAAARTGSPEGDASGSDAATSRDSSGGAGAGGADAGAAGADAAAGAGGAPMRPRTADDPVPFMRPTKTVNTLRAYLDEVAQWYFAKRAERLRAIKTPEEVRARQAWIRERLVEQLGPWPEKTPLNAKVVGTLPRDTYRIEKLIWESQPKHYVTATMYIPKGTGPFPTIIGAIGHSGEWGKSWYQEAWVSLARRGFIVLAYDPISQGERQESWDPATGRAPLDDGYGVTEHNMYGVPVLLTGMSYARYEMWDGVRAVDYLMTRSVWASPATRAGARRPPTSRPSSHASPTSRRRAT
jgi:hypothetical protein